MMMMGLHLVFTTILVLLIHSTRSCGPNMGGRSPRFSVRDWLKPGEHLPQGTSEVSMFSSGKQDEDNSSCSEKTQILSTDIVFEDPTYHSESRIATKVFQIHFLFCVFF